MAEVGLVDRVAKDKRQIHWVPFTPRDGSWRALNDAQSSAPTMVHGGATYLGSEVGGHEGWQATVASGVGSFGNSFTNGVMFHFYGRAVALRVRRADTYSQPVIPDFIIDRRVYSGTDLRVRWNDGVMGTTNEHYGLIVIDTDLPETPDGKPHTLEVVVCGDRDSAQRSRTLLFYGLMVDKISGGYSEPSAVGGIFNHAAVPLTNTAIILSPTTDVRPRGVQLVRYVNPLAVAVPIAVTYGFSGSDQPFWAKTVASGSAEDMALGPAVPTLFPAAAGSVSSPSIDGSPMKHAATMPATSLSSNIAGTSTGNATMTGGRAALGLAVGQAATVKIDSEIIAGSFSDDNTFAMTGRGQSGTTAATHNSGTNNVTLQTPGPYYAVIGVA